MPGVASLLVTISAGLASLTCDLDAFSNEVQAQFESIEVTGTYRRSFEVSAFLADNAKSEWWVYDDELARLYEGSEVGLIRVRISARISPKGKYGHLGAYAHCITEISVLEVLTKGH